ARAAGRPQAEVDELEGRCGGMRVVHVAPTREEALRATEPPFMGYQRKMAVLRSDATGGNVPNSFDRSLLRLRTFHEYLADGWARRSPARRTARTHRAPPRGARFRFRAGRASPPPCIRRRRSPRRCARSDRPRCRTGCDPPPRAAR